MRSKHKKTRKEKIIADLNRNTYVLKNKSFSTPNASTIKPLVSEKSDSYSHIIKDVFKTTILTTSIVASEIILFFLLKNHIITIPKINY